MENIIGSMSAAKVGDFIQYRIFFTENNLIAVQSSVGSGGILTNLQDWENIVETINTSRKPIVDYNVKALPNVPERYLLTWPYGKIRAVYLKQVTRIGVDPEKLQYEIKFDAGLLSSLVFAIPGESVQEVTDLIKKTPLAGKLKP